MQQSLRPFDDTDSTYTTEDFLRAITANMAKTAEPEQAASLYHEARNLKRIIVTIQTALLGPGQQWYSNFPLEIKNWQTFCREFQKDF